MLNFSKFFEAGEIERLIIYPRANTWQLYFYLLLIVILFFLLYPWWHLGDQGLILWFLSLLIILLFFARYLLRKNTYYVLSNLYLWHVFYVNENNIRNRGRLPIALISSVEALAENDILIKAGEQKFILFNVKKRDFVLNQLKEIFILPKVDKSVII